MNLPAETKRFPAWLRFLGWVAFSGLALATVFVVARWWVMKSGHERAMELVKHGRKNPKRSVQKGDAVSGDRHKSAVSRGMPVEELPLVGVYLDHNSPAGKELRAAIDEMNRFLRKNGTLSKCRVDGVLGFRALLSKMGIDVPESMTEEEAAAEFLKRADKYSGLLAQWKEAVEKGPWDCSSADDRYRSTRADRTALLVLRFPEMLGVMAEAHMRTGDTAAAWSEWQTMALSAQRCGDSSAITPGAVGGIVRNEMIRTAHAGMALGAWTDDQLARISATMGEENALDSRARDFEGEKIKLAGFFSDSPEHRQMYPEPLIDSDSPFKNLVNELSVSLTTEQQVQDNLAVIIHRMDQTIDRFDPDTGVYLAPPTGETGDSADSKPTDTWFGRFYFMYSARDTEEFFTQMPERIVKDQSAIDQLRLAVALDTYQHRTGEYPDRLDAVSDKFPGGVPRDIATGQPYFYQREPDGGYKLWGTGIDGKSEGGDAKTDVIWTKRPAKTK